MITLAIDPGVKHLGVALFEDETLVYATLLKTGDAQALSELFFVHGPPDRVVIELPQVYARSKSKGDPNDLIAVAVVVGALTACLKNAELIKPRVWKGTVDKSVFLKRILGKLEPGELALLPKLAKSLVHNVQDAVGIGLFAVGRLGKKKKLAGLHAKR